MAENPTFDSGAAAALAALSAGGQARIPALPQSAPAYLAVLAAHELKKPLLLLCHDERESALLHGEVSFFLSALAASEKPFLLPARDIYGALPAGNSGLRACCLAAMVGAGPSSPIIVTASVTAAIMRAMPPDILGDLVFEVRPGVPLDRDVLLASLVSSGYTAVSQVMEPGDFSVRGGIMDVFAPGSSHPVRVELWGDEVESLRYFDPETQKSLGRATAVTIPPLKELAMGKPITAAIDRLEELARGWKEDPDFPFDKLRMAKGLAEITGRLARGDHFPGAEAFAPYVYAEPSCALDYLDRSWAVIYLEPFLCDQAVSRRLESLEEDWRREMTETGFALPPADHFVTRSRAQELLSRLPALVAGAEAPGSREIEDTPGAPLLDLSASEMLPVFGSELEGVRAEPGSEDPLAPLIETLADFSDLGVRAIIVSPFPGKATRFQELLESHGLNFPLLSEPDGALLAGGPGLITTGPLTRGFFAPASKLAVIAESEVFGDKIRPARRPRRFEEFISDLSDLGEDDFVVHVEHGIGIYRGLVSLEVQWVGEWDFVRERERPRIRVDSAKIEYAGGASLYVPVHRLNQISKYRGATDEPPALDTLGGTAWERLKKKVKRSVRDFAEYLLGIYAARKAHRGVAFPPPDHAFREFEESFEYEETPDQLRAIEEVLADMESGEPMDRVVCGDVGYGKTEVALRAAFLAAMSGRQVAVLVPTTILAQQHFSTFAKRLSRYPVEVKVLSRFLTAGAQKKVIAEITAGKADIVIGTHRLLSKDVHFRDLGLLVVDEEHRFGVRHKEKLRELKATVDTLTLTATPIPRTLHMAMSGLRDLSIIDTPPPDRQAVHTELLRADDRVIKEAIDRELRRGGQVFYVHNRVRTIQAVADKVKSIAPQARVSVAHGQMNEGELEKIMADFVDRRIDVLVCTAIIESGLDIPTANTMLVDRADQFGLAQLYQLRGRIGRSRERGYCYLMVPVKGALTPEATKRLRALREFTELGSGFRIAAHDLEIRGAGNLLGSEQSGHITRVGMELYMELLKEEIAKRRGEEIEPEIEPEIKLPVPAFLSEDYVPDPNQRLSWYKRVSRARSGSEIDDLREELIDRYGKPSEEAENLLAMGRIKAAMVKLRIRELAYTGKELTLKLGDDSKADIEHVVELATRHPRQYRITPEGHIFRAFQAKSPGELFPAIRELLNEISPYDNILV